MKKIAAVSVLSLLTFTSCEMLGDGSSGEEGELEITFGGPASEDDTRVSSELPNTGYPVCWAKTSCFSKTSCCMSRGRRVMFSMKEVMGKFLIL